MIWRVLAFMVFLITGLTVFAMTIPPSHNAAIGLPIAAGCFLMAGRLMP